MNQVKTTFLSDRRVALSTLWIFAMFNYIYADICTLMNPESLRMLLSGYAGQVQITQEFLLGAGILMETAILMVVLSRVLKYRANRVFNIIFGVVHTLAVLLSMLTSPPPVFYLFFAIIEVACTCIIVWLAWTWKAET